MGTQNGVIMTCMLYDLKLKTNQSALVVGRDLVN